MRTLLLVAEIHEATTDEEAQAILDTFRGSVLPSSEYGISLSRCLYRDLGKFPVGNDFHEFTIEKVPGIEGGVE
jgi:hypothetical protein